jgi:hypothetical protein
MRGSTESEEAYALAFFNAGDAEAAEADDTSAEKWSGVERVEGGGYREHKIGASEGVFRVASVDGVAGEGRGVAEIFFATAAIGAGTVGAAQPGNADAGAGRCLVGQERPTHTSLADFAYDLMAGDDSFAVGSEFAFCDVEVGAADSAG